LELTFFDEDSTPIAETSGQVLNTPAYYRYRQPVGSDDDIFIPLN